MKKIALLSVTALVATSGLWFGTTQTASATSWNWSYSSGTQVNASGTFTTNDIPDNSGFYLITGITGTRNGETITSLQVAGTPVPGNEPFSIDNLISLNSQQLTGEGFGYSTESGSYSSPFFASFLTTPGYLELFSAPPIGASFEDLGLEDSELPISFFASIISVPEPTSIISLFIVSTLGAGSGFKRKKSSQVAQEDTEKSS